MPRPSQRDRVLDAYTDVVVTTGPETVTLEGVAAAAGVSKGGLLYHFGSKDALLGGLLARAEELTDADIAAGHADPDGLAAYYLRTSFDDPAADSSVFRVVVALYKLASTEPRAAAAARTVLERWRAELTAALGDPLTADLVACVGDGIYLRAIVGDASEALDRRRDELLARLLGSP